MENWLDVDHTEFQNLKRYSGISIEIDLAEAFALCAFTEIYGMMSDAESGEAATMLAEKMKETIKAQHPNEFERYFVKPDEQD